MPYQNYMICYFEHWYEIHITTIMDSIAIKWQGLWNFVLRGEMYMKEFMFSKAKKKTMWLDYFIVKKAIII